MAHPPHASTHPGDPELMPYHGLHGTRLLQHPVHGPSFLCEGQILVKDALAVAAQGRLKVHSLLTTPGLAPAFLDLLPPDTRLLVLPETQIHEMAGFAFHRGVLACVGLPEAPDPEVILTARRLLVLPRVDHQENLGLLLRTAAGLGMDAVLYGKGPSLYDRRIVRVSMGAAWKIPVHQTHEPLDHLDPWRALGGEVVGAALGPHAQDAAAWIPASRTALVLGPEGPGLHKEWLGRCHRLVTIPMGRSMDSLNVGAAGAILMWRMCTPTQPMDLP